LQHGDSEARGAEAPRKRRAASAAAWSWTAPEYLYTYWCTLICEVKRRDLEKRLSDCGWRFLRSGGRHDVWTDGEREEAVPRHREINEKLAQAILRRACKEQT